MPTLDAGRRYLAKIGALLRDSAVAGPMWELDHLQRWRLLAEILMGHPRVRGGQRPRDFPADAVTRRLIAEVVRLQRCTLCPWDQLSADVRCRFGPWLYAYCILIESSVRRAQHSHEQQELSRVAVLMLIWQTLRVLGLAKDEGSYYFFIASLGLSSNESRSLILQWHKSLAHEARCCIRDSPVVRAAAEAAALAAASRGDPQSISRAYRSNWAQVIEEMLARNLWLVSIKAQGVQRYIERARDLRLARGASAWVSQSLAIVREVAASISPTGVVEGPGMLLLTDVDAFMQFACFEQPDLSAIRSSLRRRLGRLSSEIEELRLLKPRLAQVLDEAALPRVDDLLCLPNISIQASNGQDMRSLGARPANGGKLSESADPLIEREPFRRVVIRFRRPEAGPGDCIYVRGERALIEERELPWLRGRSGNPRISWCGVIWSLSGSINGMLSSHGLCHALRLPALPAKQLHDEWIQRLGAEGDDVAYLALDGDEVGSAFAALPVLMRLPAGLELSQCMFDGLVQGSRRAIEQWRSDHDGCSIPAIPVDLIYIGGDDLVCMLPNSLLQTFLAGLADAPKCEVSRKFTGTAICVPPLTRALGQQIQAIARSLLPEALAVAKASNKQHARVAKRGIDALMSRAATLGYVLSSPTWVPNPGARVRVLQFYLRPLG